MGTKILVCDSIHEDGLEMLRKAGFELDLKTSITPDELLKIAHNYDAMIVRSRTKIIKEVIEAATNLKIIARAGVGLDNVDAQYAERKGIKVINSPEAPTNSVAELVIGFMFSMARKISVADAGMKKGEWLKNKLVGIELSGKTLGIIGFGRIGYMVAEKAKALGLKVKVFDISIDKRMQYVKALNIEATTLEDIITSSDFITVHVPLLPSTENMIDRKQIELMKKGVYLINTSRGGIINEEALAYGLKTGKLGGAALDVFVDEPPNNTDFTGISNMICTPHIGASTLEAQRANSIIIAEKLINFFQVKSS